MNLLLNNKDAYNHQKAFYYLEIQLIFGIFEKLRGETEAKQLSLISHWEAGFGHSAAQVRPAKEDTYKRLIERSHENILCGEFIRYYT